MSFFYPVRYQVQQLRKIEKNLQNPGKTTKDYVLALYDI